MLSCFHVVKKTMLEIKYKLYYTIRMEDILFILNNLGFDSYEDFIKAYFHLLTESQRKLVELIGICS